MPTIGANRERAQPRHQCAKLPGVTTAPHCSLPVRTCWHCRLWVHHWLLHSPGGFAPFFRMFREIPKPLLPTLADVSTASVPLSHQQSGFPSWDCAVALPRSLFLAVSPPILHLPIPVPHERPLLFLSAGLAGPQLTWGRHSTDVYSSKPKCWSLADSGALWDRHVKVSSFPSCPHLWHSAQWSVCKPLCSRGVGARGLGASSSSRRPELMGI